MSSETSVPKKLVVKPIIISNNKKMIIKSPNLLANIKFSTRPVQQYKEEVIYASKNCDFLKGESQEVLIINKLNLITKSSRTIAKCTSRGKSVESSSDSVCSVIGQKNYETVLSALSSVFNEETKVRGILALLSAEKTFNSTGIQTEMENLDKKVEKCCQTEDTRLNMFVKEKQRKRIRRQPLTPYVVTERPAKVKKYVININDVKEEKGKSTEKKEVLEQRTPSLPDLKLIVDEDSNMSCSSNVSLSSLPSLTGVLDNAQGILSGVIDKVTDKTLTPTKIQLRDGSVIMVPIKPEDEFHIATPEILKNVTHEERLKLIWHQAFVDFKMCLQQDEDGYYPLHIAVLSNDPDLVRRQCAALKAKHESVDISAGGLTALHMSVRQNQSTACTSILLQNGADPLLCDQERRSSLHLAAELESPQLRCLLNYCDTHSRSVLKNNSDFWRPEHEARTDEQLKKYLHGCVSEMFDDQGNTPLMLAAEAAIPANVSLLASRAGALVDTASPNCGDTALYRAVARACLQAKETGNITTASDKTLKTIEILVENGADPARENHSGSSVNTLLTEFNISAVSMTIANKMTAIKHGRHAVDTNMMLYRGNDGSIAYKDIHDARHEKTEMTEVRNIPPGLHAIITIDVPETKDKKIDLKKDVTSKLDSESQNMSRTCSSRHTQATSSKSDANEMKNIELKGKTMNSIKDLILNNAVFKNAMEDISLKNVSGLNAILVKANNENVDKNTNIQIKIGNVVLKQGNTNINLSKKNSLINPSVSKNDVDAVKATENLNIKQMNADNATDIKQTNIDIVISKDTSPKSNVKQVNEQEFKNADETDLKDDVVDKSSETTDIIKYLQASNAKTSSSKNTEDPNESPTRFAKERKANKIVIVENVELKHFSIPNILKASKRSVKAKDIVICPKFTKKGNISPKKIVVGKKNAETGQKYRKRKLE